MSRRYEKELANQYWFVEPPDPPPRELFRRGMKPIVICAGGLGLYVAYQKYKRYIAEEEMDSPPHDLQHDVMTDVDGKAQWVVAGTTRNRIHYYVADKITKSTNMGNHHNHNHHD